jgi:putative sigma-54 modulation protein
MDMTNGLKEHVESGLEKIKDHFDRVIDADVILSVEKNRHIAEFNLHANGLRINAKESSDDLYASIDSALTKVDRQVGKYRDRINRHKPRSNKDIQDFHHQIIQFDDDHLTAHNEEPEEHQVIHREKLTLQTMNINEAAVQLELLHDDFLVFSNADTQQVNVVYSRKDGTYGLIEPQF